MIFWLSSQEALPSPPGLSFTIGAVVGHFITYCVLATLLLFAIGDDALPRGKSLALSGALAALYALSDEFHQSFVPGRDASPEDLLVDVLGICCALALWSLRWRRTATS